MKKQLLLLLLLALAGCRTSQTITLLHINDVYEIAPLDNGAVGGMARVATVYQDLKAQNPNTFFLHAGDFLSPSVIGTLKYEGKTIRGRQMVEVMNSAGVQYAALGNHEFDLDDDEPKNLQERINESRFQWVAANVSQKQGTNFVPFARITNGQRDLFPTSVILKTPKAKIGVLAVSIPVNKPYVQITDPIEAAKAEYERLKTQCDAVVALTHINIADDKRLAEALPGLKLIMGGHDHDNMRVLVGDVPICKADANAKTVYVHRLTVGRRGRVTVVSELKKVDPATPENPATAAVVTKWQRIADQSFNDLGFDQKAVVTVAAEPWDGRETTVRNEHNYLTTTIAKAIRAANPGSDIAVYNGGSIRVDDVLRGNITQYDIVRILPFGGGLQTVTMTGELLQKILETGRLNVGRGGYLHSDVAVYDERAKTWAINGQPVGLTRDYRVALPGFLMTGKEFGMSYLTPENPGVKSTEKASKTNPADLRADIRKALIAYFNP